MGDRSRNSSKMVYGEISDGLVFLHEETALGLARLHEALRQAGTWGEFRTLVPEDDYKDAVERYNEQRAYEDDEDREFDPDEEPPAEASFAADEIPGYEEGDWPAWPAGSMDRWIPKEIQRTFGSMERTAISGDYLYLPPHKEREIVAALREHGYAYARDDGLVERASGY